MEDTIAIVYIGTEYIYCISYNPNEYEKTPNVITTHHEFGADAHNRETT